MRFKSTVLSLCSCFFLLGASILNAYETIYLDVPEGARESVWTAALAEHWQGETEVRVRFGSVDLVTPKRVIEVDRLKKFHEGIGQVIHYNNELPDRQGTLAIIIENEKVKPEKIAYIEKLCQLLGFELCILKRSSESNPL